MMSPWLRPCCCEAEAEDVKKVETESQRPAEHLAFRHMATRSFPTTCLPALFDLSMCMCMDLLQVRYIISPSVGGARKFDKRRTFALTVSLPNQP
jgi:hypothetical protein